MKHLLIISTFLLCSCASEPDYPAYLKEMGISLADNYTVIEHKSETAMGDFTSEFSLKISDKDFAGIITKIKQTENYNEYKNGESPNSFNKFGRDYQISAFKLVDNYFYRKEETAEATHYEIVLRPDKTLHFTYSED